MSTTKNKRVITNSIFKCPKCGGNSFKKIFENDILTKAFCEDCDYLWTP